MDMHNEIDVVFMAANATSILSPWIRRNLDIKVLLFKKCICKDIAATDSDSSDGSGQSKLKTFWKGFTILNAIKSICDSWEEMKYIEYQY